MTRNERVEWCLRMQRRILRNVEVHEESGCWLWTGRCNNAHYGVLSMRVPGCRSPRPLFAHRVAWEAFRFRRMPTGRVGAHSLRCVARRCCNPLHVRATTQSHNRRDVERKKAIHRRGAPPCSWGNPVRMKADPTHTIFRKRSKKPPRFIVDGVVVPF